MATFRVDITRIKAVRPHPGADRLDLAWVDAVDLQFVVGRGDYRVGDVVLYFPVDSLLPESLVAELGLTGRLSGPQKNRVKTVCLRHQISQGLVMHVAQAIDYLHFMGHAVIALNADDLTEALGVEKYEPPVIPCLSGYLIPLPQGVGVYDIEGVERHPEVVDILARETVVVTEKVEGQNAGLTITEDGEVIINQRNFAIQEEAGAEHMIGKAFRAAGLDVLAQRIQGNRMGCPQVTLRGELIGPGIQGNYYGLKDHKVLLFDIMVDGLYVDYDDLLEWVPEEHRVPTLFVGDLQDFMEGQSIADVADGPSRLADVRREGVVIKPLVESYLQDFGRVILKKRGPQYLANEN